MAKVPISIVGFVSAEVAAAMRELMQREGMTSIALVEAALADRARAAGILGRQIKGDGR